MGGNLWFVGFFVGEGERNRTGVTKSGGGKKFEKWGLAMMG